MNREFITGLLVSFGSAVALGFIASFFGMLLFVISGLIATVIFIVLNASYIRNEKNQNKRRGLEVGFVFFFLPFLVSLLVFNPSFFLPYNRSDITNLAIRFNNPGICNFVPASDSEPPGFPVAKPWLCFNDVAIATKNPASCDYLNVKNELSSDFRMNCYVKSGAPLKELYKKCEDFSNSSSYDEAFVKGDCLSSLAVKLEDENICEKTENNLAKYRCYLSFVEGSQEARENICEEKASLEADKIYGNGSYPGAWRDECYHKLAFIKKDVSFCFKISLEKAIISCQKSVFNLK